MNLEPLTEYTITVTCVNDAGPGNTSTPMMIETARKECVDTVSISPLFYNRVNRLGIVHTHPLAYHNLLYMFLCLSTLSTYKQ